MLHLCARLIKIVCHAFRIDCVTNASGIHTLYYSFFNMSMNSLTVFLAPALNRTALLLLALSHPSTKVNQLTVDNPAFGGS